MTNIRNILHISNFNDDDEMTNNLPLNMMAEAAPITPKNGE